MKTRKYTKKVAFQVVLDKGFWVLKTQGRTMLCADMKDAIHCGFRVHSNK